MNETFWHMAAYFASLTNGSTNAAVAAVQDNVLTRTTNNNYILPQPGRLRMAFSAGVSISNARINTPSLRYVGLPSVGLLNATLAVPNPPNFTDWGDQGPPLPTADEISVEHSLGGAAPENEFTFLWFQFRNRPVPGGPVYRLRFTGTVAGVAGTWTSGVMTPDQTLPQGMYAVVGMTAMGTNLAGARLIFPGATYRPGCLGTNVISNTPARVFVDGSLGLWGVFNSVNVPALETFAIGANAAQTVFLDVVRQGDRPLAA